MDDTRLLELAGLASGESYGPNSNPLESNDLALRLAVKLSQLDGGVTLMLNSRFGSSEFAQCITNDRVIAPDEFMGDDPGAATRRAIVRAAAAVGASQ